MARVHLLKLNAKEALDMSLERKTMIDKLRPDEKKALYSSHEECKIYDDKEFILHEMQFTDIVNKDSKLISLWVLKTACIN